MKKVYRSDSKGNKSNNKFTPDVWARVWLYRNTPAPSKTENPKPGIPITPPLLFQVPAPPEPLRMYMVYIQFVLKYDQYADCQAYTI